MPILTHRGNREKGTPMNRVFRSGTTTAVILLLTVAGVRMAVSAETALPPVLITFQDYLGMPDDALPVFLEAAGEPRPEVVRFGLDAHGSAASAGPGLFFGHLRIWTVWSGEESLADFGRRLNHVHLSSQMIRMSAAPRRALILELHESRLIEPRKDPDGFDLVVAGVRLQVQSARRLSTPVLLSGLAAPLNCTVGPDRKPWTDQSTAQVLEPIEQAHLALAVQLDAVVAPVWRAFVVLRRSRPDLNLHMPVGDDDTHLSPCDGYLAACVGMTALLGRRVPELSEAQQDMVFGAANGRAANDAKRSGKEPPPPLRLASADQKSIHDAAWQAVQEWQTLVAAVRADAQRQTDVWKVMSAVELSRILAKAYATPDPDPVRDLAVSRLPQSLALDACGHLQQSGDPAMRRLVPVMVRRAGMADKALRELMLAGLARESDPDVASDLGLALGLLHGAESDVQQALMTRATAANAPAAEARRIVTVLIDHLPKPRRAPFLIDALQAAGDRGWRRDLTWRILQYERPVPLAAVRAVLADGLPESAESLYWLEENPEVAPEIVRQAGKPAFAFHLGRVLLRWGKVEGIAVLAALVGDPSQPKRAEVILTLVEQTPRNRDLAFRTAAAKALADFAGRDDLPISERKRSVEGLAALVPQASAHRSCLVELSENKETELAAAARKALVAIDAMSKP